MIWHDGALLDDDMLKVGIDDRVFEHGLGLFETFRSWDGRAPLLGRHLERLRTSAKALGIPLERVRLPGRNDVAALLDATSPPRDAMLRLTVTAGSESGRAPVGWLSARPLPQPEPTPLHVVALEDAPPPASHSHKMLNYWDRRKEYDRAAEIGAAEIVRVVGGWVFEGSRNNVLLVPAGRTRVIASPGLLPWNILPGIMRRVALDFAADHGYEVEERLVGHEELAGADAVFLTNSVRGVRPVSMIDFRPIDMTPQAELARLYAEELPRFLRNLPDADEPTP